MKRINMGWLAAAALAAMLLMGSLGRHYVKQGYYEIYVDVNESIQAAVNMASDGTVINLLPGAHTDSNVVVNKAIFFAGKGPLRSVRMTASDTIFVFTAAARGTSFTNLMINCGGAGSWIRAGAVNYSMRDCHVRAQVFNIGDNVTYFEGCQFDIGTYGGMYAGGTTGSSADTAWFEYCQWRYPLFVEAVWQYPLSTGDPAAGTQNGIRVVDGAFAHTRYCQIYSDSTCINVASDNGFAGGYFGIFYNGGDGSVFTNNSATAGGDGSFLWSAMSNNDATNANIILADSGSVSLVDNFIVNKGTGGKVYISTSKDASAIFGGHYTSSATGGTATMTIPAVDYPEGLRGWIDNGSAASMFVLGDNLKIIDDGIVVRNLIGTIGSTDTTFWTNGDSVLYDVTRDRGPY